MIVIGLLGSIGVLSATHADAAQLRNTPETYNIGENEIINDDIYIIEDESQTATTSIEVAGTINGDLAVAGGNIVISGYITGNLYIAGGNVELTGDVEKSAYIACGDANISGHIGRDLYLATGMVDFTGSAEEDLTVFSGQGTIAGIVGDDLRTSSGNITISSTVGGDLISMSGMAVADEAVVTGESIIKSGDTSSNDTEISFPSEIETVETVKDTVSLASILGTIWGRTISAVGILLVGFLCIWLMPVKTYTISKKMSNSGMDLLIDLGIGFATIVTVPFVCGILLISQIGAPLAILLMGIAFFITLFGTNWFDLYIGSVILKLFKIEHNSYGALSTGVFVRLLISFIPVITFIYWFLTVAVATGAVIRVKYDSYKNSRGADESKTSKVALPKKAKKGSKK